MVNQMHGKQMVIKRKYELPNKEMCPSPVCSLDGGGFNNFSRFGGHSRLLISHIFRMIVATSAVRPLHNSHLGDSGITNLKNIIEQNNKLNIINHILSYGLCNNLP